MSMQLPKAYKETYREIMLADPNVVNLHKLGWLYVYIDPGLGSRMFLAPWSRSRIKKRAEAAQNKTRKPELQINVAPVLAPRRRR